jgi:hypothetical protein
MSKTKYIIISSHIFQQVIVMADEKKIGWKKETHIKQSLDVNKGPTLFGSVHPIKPKEYTCDICGTIVAADVLWKDTKDGVQEPFCGKCRKRVALSSKQSNS